MLGALSALPRVLRRLTGLVVLGAAMGLLLAGIAVPAVGAMGTAATGSVSAYKSLPSEFSIPPLAQASRILDASGKLIANPYDENRIIVPLKKIAPIMQQAQIAIEDSRFYDHGPIDPRGFTRALVSNLQGKDIQGASTLTQQYVKITMQEDALRQDDQKKAEDILYNRTYSRKLQELKYAENVEQQLTKDQILAGYLNLVNYGDQSYGVEAAAQNYFGVHASELNLNQAALLAGIVRSPNYYNPAINPDKAQQRRDVVLDRMVQLGLATEKQAAAAKKVPVKKMLHLKPDRGVCQRSSQPYFCSYVLEWLENSPQMSALGKTPQERHDKIYQGGLTIKTTLRPKMQKAAYRELTRAVPVNNKSNLGGGVTIIEPGTGEVLASVQASKFSKTQVNWNVDRKYGGVDYGWQFGSTAKAFALTTALDRGMPINATIYAPKAGPSTPYFFPADAYHDECSAAKFEVRNDYTVGGNIPLQTATSQSINTAFANLTIQLGACSVRDMMTKMGLHSGNGEPISKAPAAIALGGGETTTMSIASAYATLAAKGKYCEPFPVTSIKTADNKAIKFQGSDCKQVISKDVAAGVTQLLKGPLTNGTAAGVWNMSERVAAGKTGTTNNHNQAWFVGYTPQLSTAVWIGNLRPADKNGNLYTLNGKCFGKYGCFGSVFGGTIAAPVWAKVMRAASKGMPVKGFPTPSNKIENGDYVNLPSVVGYSVSSAQARLRDAGFTSYVVGKINSSVAAGLVAGTQPSGRALKNSSVGLLISLGPKPQPKPPKQTKPNPKPTNPVPRPPRPPGPNG